MGNFAGTKNYLFDNPCMGKTSRFATNSKTCVEVIHEFQLEHNVLDWAADPSFSTMDATAREDNRRDYGITLSQVVMSNISAIFQPKARLMPVINTCIFREVTAMGDGNDNHPLEPALEGMTAGCASAKGPPTKNRNRGRRKPRFASWQQRRWTKQ